MFLKRSFDEPFVVRRGVRYMQYMWRIAPVTYLMNHTHNIQELSVPCGLPWVPHIQNFNRIKSCMSSFCLSRDFEHTYIWMILGIADSAAPVIIPGIRPCLVIVNYIYPTGYPSLRSHARLNDPTANLNVVSLFLS